MVVESQGREAARDKDATHKGYVRQGPEVVMEEDRCFNKVRI